MESHLVRQDAQRTHVLFFGEGDEVVEELLAFAQKQELAVASFTGVGALKEVTLGYYNPETQQYDDMPLKGDQFELVSLVGAIYTEDGALTVNAHAALGQPQDGSALGGHLLRGVLRPGAIVTLVELPLETG
jgi:uncharacterized protein